MQVKDSFRPEDRARLAKRGEELGTDGQLADCLKVLPTLTQFLVLGTHGADKPGYSFTSCTFEDGRELSQCIADFMCLDGVFAHCVLVAANAYVKHLDKITEP